MGFLGFFLNWHERVERDFLRKAPYVYDLYAGSIGTRLRLNALRDSLSATARKSAQPKMHAFHLGQIEGDTRRLLNVANSDLTSLMRTVIGAALYAATKERIISNDEEWAQLGNDMQEGYMNPVHSDARRLGLGASGVAGGDPEESWRQFEEMLRSYR